MRQFQFNYENNEKLINSIKKIKQWCMASVTSEILFQIYTEQLNYDKVRGICNIIRTEMPEAKYIGCSTNGNIVMGELAESPITIICTVFEYASTKVSVLQYHLEESNVDEVTDSIKKHVKENPWVKSVILNITIRGMSMTRFCENLSSLPKDVAVFGGGAFSENMQESQAFCFSSEGDLSDHSVVIALVGGDEYHVETIYITGWKPLGKEFHVTKTDGFILYEIDDKPAYEIYRKYLNIKNDKNFFLNTLEFPFFYEHNGINILRAPTASNPDGSLVMTADMDENVKARLAYGDPWTILDSVKKDSVKLSKFAPEVIMVFSCAARRAFWGADEISGESLPFQSLAPTSGFYTSGEFLRTGKDVNQHNVTLVVAAQREGEIDADSIHEVDVIENEMSGKVSMINRLATFIQAATEELEEANQRLLVAARTDGLTGLLNRAKIQSIITDETKEIEEDNSLKASLIMMDIDDFKSVNDKYGHKEGDFVLKGLSDMIQETVKESNPDASSGRWGGEEFMVLLPGFDEERSAELAEKLRIKFNEIEFPEAGRQTMSLGVTEIIPNETSDSATMRVDKALYKAKAAGKNRVVRL